MYALDATTGNILWNFASGGTVIDGPSIVDGALYWGSGYREIAGTGNNKVFAFTLADEKDRGEHSDDHDHDHDHDNSDNHDHSQSEK
jgi:polyvinyl alcohol dehydrogenase (cytochrome)